MSSVLFKEMNRGEKRDLGGKKNDVRVWKKKTHVFR